jgi:heptaprenyl diphosphate synthase
VKISDLADLLQINDLERRLDAVDERLRAVLASGGNGLAQASLRVAGAGGKRLRPVFAIAASSIGGRPFDRRVISAAVAVELVQVGSLVHDDVFEKAETRRGVPTINAVEGVNVAVMAGDFILARAGEEAVRVGTEAGRLLAATVIRLCEGQLAEMGDQFDPARTVDSYLRSIRAKTAVLFATACHMGALCADLPAETVERVVAFGDNYGMAFQLLDDVLDFTADPVKLGKPVGIDLDTGVYTLPVLTTLASPEGHHLAELLGRRDPDDVVAVRQAVLHSGALEATLALARQYAAEASRVVEPLGEDDPVAAGLARLPSVYLDWALDHFVDHHPRSDAG